MAWCWRGERRFGFAVDLIGAQLGLVRTLRGLTPKFGSFDDEQFERSQSERRFAENPDLAFAECWYWIRKLQARFFAGDYPAAVEAASRAQNSLDIADEIRNGGVSLLRGAFPGGAPSTPRGLTSGSRNGRL